MGVQDVCLEHPIISAEEFIKRYENYLISLVWVNIPEVKFQDIIVTAGNVLQEELNVYIWGNLYPPEKILSFTLSQMPGNAGILISHNLEITKEFRRRGISTSLQKFKEKFCLEQNYSLLICTTRQDNSVQNDILSNYGWGLVKTIYNLKTGNSNQFWMKDSFS